MTRHFFGLGLMPTLWILCVVFLLVGETQAVEPSVGRWYAKFPASFSTDGHHGPSGIQSSTSNVDCREVGKLNQSDRCSFIRHNPNCKMDSGFLNYLKGVFCVFPAALQPLAITLYVLWLLYLFVILGVTAEKFFCPNLSAISTKLRLAHNVAGVTFLAFGNGAPDIFSAVVAFSDPRTAGLAIGALFGAGIFVTTIVAGGIALMRPFTAASRPFLRDAIFYMISVFLTFVALYFEQVTLAEALSFLGLYIFYVLTVVVSTWLHRRQRRERLAPPSHPEPELSTDSEEGDNANVNGEEEYQPLLPSEETTFRILTQSINPLDYRKWRRKPCYWKLLKACKLPVELVLLLTVPIVDPDRDDQNWKRPLNCLHLVTGPLICILALKSGTYGLYKLQGVFPVWGLVVLVGATLAAILFCVTRNEEPPRCHFLFAFLGFFVSAMWINAAATEVVNILQTLGIIFHLSNTVLGLTLLAWGNSIGDMFSDLTMARQGYPRMAFSACFGARVGRPLGMDSSRCPGPQPGHFFPFGACPVLPSGISLWLLPHSLLHGLSNHRAAHRVRGDPNFQLLNGPFSAEGLADVSQGCWACPLDPVIYLKMVPFGDKDLGIGLGRYPDRMPATRRERMISENWTPWMWRCDREASCSAFLWTRFGDF